MWSTDTYCSMSSKRLTKKYQSSSKFALSDPIFVPLGVRTSVVHHTDTDRSSVVESKLAYCWHRWGFCEEAASPFLGARAG